MKDKPECIAQFGMQMYQVTTDQNYKWLRQ